MNNEIIDMHVHFGAPANKNNDCYWSDRFTHNAAFIIFLLATRSLFKKISHKRIRKHTLKVINKSKYVDKCVLLAFDEVYNEDGKRNKEMTNLYVPDDYIIDLAKNNNRILFGASVHPYRADWENELDKCLQNKAVLCKWIPSSQMFNPDDKRCNGFYEKLAECNLPLLCHCGPEHAIPTSKPKYNKYNNPEHLEKALNMGVTVIIAHCAMPYFGFMEPDYHDDFNKFIELFKQAEKKDWKLYADVSALATIFRIQYYEKIIKYVPAERLLFGSDYPHPVLETPYNTKMTLFSWLKLLYRAIKMKNLLDKNYLVFKNSDLGNSMFTNAAKLFSEIKY